MPKKKKSEEKKPQPKSNPEEGQELKKLKAKLLR